MSAMPEETVLARAKRLQAEIDAQRRKDAGEPEVTYYRAERTVNAAGLANPELYARKSLHNIAARIAALPEGVRDHEINRELFNAGALVRDGLIQHEELIDAVMDAIQYDFTWNHAKVREKCMRAPRDGADKRRDVEYGEKAPDVAADDWSGLIAPKVEPDARDTPNASRAEGEPDPDDAEELRARMHARAVAQELATLRARDEAKTIFAAEKAARDFREPTSTRSLVEELALPDDPVEYAIEELLPLGGNALLTASFKSGKTTMLGDLARAFADGTPFLGKFGVNTGGGRLAIFNYELSDKQYRRWLRELGIVNLDKVCVLHLRGYRLPITSKSVEDWVVRWLVEHEVTFWNVDPFARAFTGSGAENDNGDVGVFLDTLDVIKERAGVSDLILPVHTGRMEMEQGQERARGATRLDDWADVRWLLTSGKPKTDGATPARFFRATGRDVELPEAELVYDETNRSLHYGGGDRNWAERRDAERGLWTFIVKNPGAVTRSLEKDSGVPKGRVPSAVAALVSGGYVRREEGERNAVHHFATGKDYVL